MRLFSLNFKGVQFMSNKICPLCEVDIHDLNRSDEHVILNAFGGRLKAKSFICDSCNNNAGAKWDSELAKQLNPLALFFGIKRERGSSPSEIFSTTDGRKLLF